MIQNFLRILDISTKPKPRCPIVYVIPSRIRTISLAHDGANRMVRKLNIFQFETAPRGSTLLVQHQAEIPFTNRINLY